MKHIAYITITNQYNSKYIAVTLFTIENNMEENVSLSHLIELYDYPKECPYGMCGTPWGHLEMYYKNDITICYTINDYMILKKQYSDPHHLSNCIIN
jgi:hypothetical protein